jgi:hypothetical protein
MKVTRVSRSVVGLASIVLAGTAAGATYAAVSPAVSSGTTDVIRQTGYFIPLPELGGGQNRSRVIEVQLPAGKWVLHADLTVSGDADYYRCAIVKGPNATKLVQASTYISAGADTIGLTTAVKSTRGFVGGIICWHDAPLAHTPTVEPGATLWAHKTASLDKT